MKIARSILVVLAVTLPVACHNGATDICTPGALSCAPQSSFLLECTDGSQMVEIEDCYHEGKYCADSCDGGAACCRLP